MHLVQAATVEVGAIRPLEVVDERVDLRAGSAQSNLPSVVGNEAVE